MRQFSNAGDTYIYYYFMLFDTATFLMLAAAFTPHSTRARDAMKPGAPGFRRSLVFATDAARQCAHEAFHFYAPHWLSRA